MVDVCTQHDLLLRQIMELGNELSRLKTTLIRVIIAAVTASSTLLGTLVVV